MSTSEITSITDRLLSLSTSNSKSLEEMSLLYNQLTLLNSTTNIFDRAKLENLLKQKFFYIPSFSIYGGVQGFYDYGPIGCATQANIIALWRKHFILEERMLEVDCSIITPEPVLKASGHVDRFTDYMVKDTITGACYRADHLIKQSLENKLKATEFETFKNELRNIIDLLDGFTREEMNSIFKKYDIRASITDNPVTELMPFNLMFSTFIGPTGGVKGFLRPETAQGMFVNFDSLLRFNQYNVPFAAAQIGKSFRNEISPRSGLIRVREFTMAEIEHFVDPTDKSHPKFSSVSLLKINLLSQTSQRECSPTREVLLGEAVSSGIIANETLGYYIGRIYLFLIAVGVKHTGLRFRQHLPNEMAHYACDCWDAECLTSYGWIECVGCADRSCYDLCQHSTATRAKLVASRHFDEPVKRVAVNCNPVPKVINTKYKKETSAIVQSLKSLSPELVEKLREELSNGGVSRFEVEGNIFEVTPEMVQFSQTEKIVSEEDYVPGVIEPSFGIGRIIYSVLEQNFSCREDSDTRTYIALPPPICPYKCAVFALSKNKDLLGVVGQIESGLHELGVPYRSDNSGTSIGKKYVRNDQLSVPFAITVDFDSLKDSTVTVRDRDSMLQIRVPIADVGTLVASLSATGKNSRTWGDVILEYPLFRSS